MSKKMKLNLDELKVQSFVTALNEDYKNEILGGLPPVATDPHNTATCTPECRQSLDPKACVK